MVERQKAEEEEEIRKEKDRIAAEEAAAAEKKRQAKLAKQAGNLRPNLILKIEIILIKCLKFC